MKPEEIKEIEERIRKATPSPWVPTYDWYNGPLPMVCREEIKPPFGDHEYIVASSPDNEDTNVIACTDIPEGNQEEQAFANIEFIAHARQDIPKLLAYIRFLEEEKRRLEKRFLTLRLDSRRRTD